MTAINIEFDVPSVLAELNARDIQRLVNVAAQSYNNDIHDWIDAGNAFTTRKGQLEGSINWHSNGDGSATVYANAEYARFVEDGTRAHDIRPRNGHFLRFPVGGGAGFGFARGVHHPGSKAHPFFFADQDARVGRAEAEVLSVLAEMISG